MASLVPSSLLQSWKVLILLTFFSALIPSYLIQYPQPEFNLSYYSDLAATYCHEHTDNSHNNIADASASPHRPLNNVTIVVTGATSGLGLGLTKTLHKLGGTIVTVGRSKKKLADLKQELDKEDDDATTTSSSSSSSRIIPIIADFSDLDQVSSAAESIKEIESIDYLVNNAGMAYSPHHWGKNLKTVQGYDSVFGVNYLSHFLFSEKLLNKLKQSRLKSGPKIIQISSSTHIAVDGSDLVPSSTITTTSSPTTTSSSSLVPMAAHFQPTFVHTVKAYANSKLAQIYHGRSILKSELSSSSSSSSSQLKVVNICPTWVATNIARDDKLGSLMVKKFGYSSDGFGIAPILFAMFHPEAGSTVMDGRDYVTNFHTTTTATSSSSSKTTKELSDCISSYDLGKVFFGKDLQAYFVMGIGGPLLMFFQKFFAKVDFCLSSKHSYDEVKQDALYKWSKEAVSEWLM